MTSPIKSQWSSCAQNTDADILPPFVKNFLDSMVPYFILLSIVSSLQGSSGSLWTIPFRLLLILFSKSALTLSYSFCKYLLPQGSQTRSLIMAIALFLLKSLQNLMIAQITFNAFATINNATTVIKISYIGLNWSFSILELMVFRMSGKPFSSFRTSLKRFAEGSRSNIN